MFLICKDRFGRITEAFRAFLSYLNFQTIMCWQLQQISTSTYIRGSIMSYRKLRFSRNSYLVCPTVTVLQMFNCSMVHLYNCTAVYFLTVHMYNCSFVQICICTSVHLYICSIVQLLNCTTQQLSNYETVQLYNVKLYNPRAYKLVLK